MIAYFNNEFLDKDAVRISPDDRGFLFGDGLYEVIRYYPGRPGRLFRAGDHISRLNFGADHLRLSCTDFSYLEETAKALINQNNLADEHALVYFQVTRGVAMRNHAFPVPAPELTVYGTASSMDYEAKKQKMARGIRAVTVPDNRWARCDMKTTCLVANVLANQEAVDREADEAVFVRDGVLMEGTHSNFFAVVEDTLVTAPLSNYILGGITRKVVLELAEQEGIPVSLYPLFEKDIQKASEMMITGTTTEVTPVTGLNGRPVGEGTPGPVTRKLQAAFRAATLQA